MCVTPPGDDEAKRRGVQKSILERAAPPTFDVAVEMLERTRWCVYTGEGFRGGGGCWSRFWLV
jgi:hypothetical protein